MSEHTVLVTGGTGYIGGHVIDQLLKQGSTVKAIVRPGREPALRAIFPDASKTQLQAVEIPSLSSSDYTEALKDVTGVIHLAIPNPVKGATSEEVFDGVYNATLHIVKSAVKAGIKKIIVSGTMSTLLDATGEPGTLTGDNTIGPNSWAPYRTPADSKGLDPYPTYQVAKTIGERDLLEIGAKVRDEGIDVISMVMPTVYGPLLPNYPKPKSRMDLSVGDFVYSLIAGGPKGPKTWPYDPGMSAWFIDVRDAAKAHILALTSKPSPVDKRIIIVSKVFKWPEIAEVIRTQRPELADRLPSSDIPPPDQMSYVPDLTLARDILGLKEYIPWEDTILKTIDVGLILEQ